jgi:hypothetical protein
MSSFGVCPLLVSIYNVAPLIPLTGGEERGNKEKSEEWKDGTFEDKGDRKQKNRKIE